MTTGQLEEKLKNGTASLTDPAERLRFAAEELALFFAVRIHEVGIFKVNPSKHEIVFIWPQGMTGYGHIPLNAINSLVAKTANDRAATLDNSFASSRHLFIFEHMLAEKSDRIPLQKIMSAPIIDGDEVLGVLQISRKAPSLTEAGVDFTPRDIEDLKAISTMIANYLV
ncbi:MAG TPA: GAF domain-containing protein [Geobacteraceae bacterium]|nr:GAF domain-containing protein [Geobacteraceae bacterium]